MKNLTFKQKLTLFVIAIGIIPLLALAYISMNSASKSLQEAIYRGNEVFLINAISKTESYFEERAGDAAVISSSDNIQSMFTTENYISTPNDIRFLDNIGVAYGYSNIYVIDLNGKIISCDNKDLIGADLSSRAYVQKAIGGETNWSDLFYSDVAKYNTMVLAHPIKVNGRTKGVLGIAIDQNQVNKLVHDGVKSIGESGDAYIVNEDLLLLSETMLGDYVENSALVNSVDSEGTRSVADALKREDFEYRSVGQYLDYLDNPVLGALGTTHLGDKHVGLIIEVDVSEAMAPVKALQKLMLLVGVVVVALMIVVALIVIRSILKPIKTVNLMLEDINSGDGDLTKRLNINTKDEYGELGGLFNKFVESLRILISGISENAVTLATSSTEISASIDESNRSLDEVNMKVSAINESITSNASTLEEINASIEEISSTGSVVSEKAREAADSSNEVYEATRLGSENLQIAKESVLDVQRSSEKMSEVITRLNQSSIKISEIVNIITDISGQVNLLALNAAIEAARAGEHGKGFAVVADEVRKLAEETRKSAEGITEIVVEITGESNKAMAAVEVEKKQVEKSVDNIQKTDSEFVTILDKIRSVSEFMNNISEMVENQATVTDDVSRAVADITKTTVDSATDIGEITANVQTQSASFEEITASIEELNMMAEVLQTETSKFKV